MKLNVPVLLLLLILLPIPVPVPRPLPTWHQEKRESDEVYLDELIRRFGVKHRMQPQESTGVEILPISTPRGITYATQVYTDTVRKRQELIQKLQDSRAPLTVHEAMVLEIAVSQMEWVEAGPSTPSRVPIFKQPRREAND